MKFLFAVLGTHGDVLPFLAIGEALVRRGHAVSLCAPEPFRAQAGRAGLAFEAMCTQEDYDRGLGEPNLWKPLRGPASLMGIALAFAETTLAWIERHAGDAACVVASPNAFGARIARDKLGIRLVTLHVIPFLIESRIAAPRLPGLPGQGLMPSALRHWFGRAGDRVLLDPAGRPPLNAIRERHGLPPAGRLRFFWNSPDRMLLAFPAWYAPPQEDWPAQARQVGFPLADRMGDVGELEPGLAAFLDAGPPPLVFTYGSGMRRAARFFDVAVAICRRMGRRGVLLSREEGQVPAALPDGVIRVRYAPLSLLLPRSAALIHHGGIGTVAQALAAGTPQIVVPIAFNHFDDGHRLAEHGLGAVIGRRAFTPGRAARRLAAMLADPAMAEARAAIRARMAAEDGIGEACVVIEAEGRGV